MNPDGLRGDDTADTAGERDAGYTPPEVTTYGSEELEERIGPVLTGSAWE